MPQDIMGPPAVASSSHQDGDRDARLSERESSYQSAQSFDARDLDEEYPSEVAEEEAVTRKPDTGGVDPTVRRSPMATSFVAEAAPTGRTEKGALSMPKELPTVSDLHHWLALAAAALVEASAYDDRAEVAWFSKVNDPQHNM